MIADTNFFKSNIKSITSPNIITVYHGCSVESFISTFGKGNSKHDYGAGFYLTKSEKLAKEWAAASVKDRETAWCHSYNLDLTNLSCLKFNNTQGLLEWLAVLAYHRESDNTKRYKLNAEKLISKYYPDDISNYDVIEGYRADDSYFRIAKDAIKDDLNISLLNKLFNLGDLGMQIFIQSEKAFSSILEHSSSPKQVSYMSNLFDYKTKDINARRLALELISSDQNDLTDTIYNYI